jgi:hypothetical protein
MVSIQQSVRYLPKGAMKGGRGARSCGCSMHIVNAHDTPWVGVCVGVYEHATDQLRPTDEVSRKQRGALKADGRLRENVGEFIDPRT